MRLLLSCVLSSFLLIISINAKSQSNTAGIQGKLFLQNSLVADAASIVLIRLKDSSVVGGAAITKDGLFHFINITPTDYVIRITHIGYLPYVSAPIQVVTNEINELPAITLVASPAVLKEVTITNRKAFIETHSDRTVLNIDKGIMASGASVMEILNNAPGVKIAPGGGDVLFKGGLKAGIAINGRLITLSAQDIVAQLQSMQSTGVAQIELIANPGAKYDAAGPGGLINIIMKKSAAEGFNGTAEAMVGYGNASKGKVGINMNYRSGSVNIFGNYGVNENNTNHTIINDRYIGNVTNFNMNYYNSQKSYNNTYSGGLDYNIDSRHTLGVLVTGYYNNFFLDKRTLTSIANVGKLDSALTTTSTLNRRVASNNFNLNYTGKLGSTDQTIAADADFDIFDRTAAEDLASDLLRIGSGTHDPLQTFRNYAPSHITTASGRVDYVNPLSKTGRFEAGLKFVAVKSDNRQNFDNVFGAVKIPDSKLSSQFIYAESISAAYATFTGTPSEKFNYQLGLRAEHTESNANTVSEAYVSKRSYTDLFPAVTFNYTPGANNMFSLMYNRRIDRPDYQSLNPIIAYQDRYNFNSGNAYLRAAYTDRIELKHTYLDKFTTSLYAAFTKDSYNFTYFSQNDATGAFTNGKMNLKAVRTYGIDIDAPVDVTKWWNIDFTAGGSYWEFEDYADKLNKNAYDLILQAANTFTLPVGLSMYLKGSYETPTFYYIYDYKSSYAVGGGIRKSVLNKLGTLTFNVDDIFNTSRDRYTVNYLNLRLDGFDKKETRVFRLTFSYRFGKSTVKSRKHVSGNSEDLKRLGGN